MLQVCATQFGWLLLKVIQTYLQIYPVGGHVGSVPGGKWVCLEESGCAWRKVGVPGGKWVCLEESGCVWRKVGVSGGK